MKVLLVCSESFKKGRTGDATQARETYGAIVAKGHQVSVIYVRREPLSFVSEHGEGIDKGKLEDIIASVDVVHLLPCGRDLIRFWRSLKIRRPTLGSTIFWGGWERVSMAWRSVKPLKERLHWMARYFRQMWPIFMDYRGVDVFLPNSRAEGDCVKRCFRTDPHSVCHAVPNGFIKPKFDIFALPRPKDIPQGEYIVVPGIFAVRKNQLGLVRALRGTQYPLVFMGGIYGAKPDRLMQAACRRECGERAVFLGHVSNESQLYWATLRYARCACLASDCETPAIAMLEAAYAGARPVITKFGGTREYYGEFGEYFDPRFPGQIRMAVDGGWRRGRLTDAEAASFGRFTWQFCAEETIKAYERAAQMRV